MLIRKLRRGIALPPAFVVMTTMRSTEMRHIRNRALALGLLERFARLPALAQIAHSIRLFSESASTLLPWRSLLLAICVGLISWFGEYDALYFVSRGLAERQKIPIYAKNA